MVSSIHCESRNPLPLGEGGRRPGEGGMHFEHSQHSVLAYLVPSSGDVVATFSRREKVLVEPESESQT